MTDSTNIPAHVETKWVYDYDLLAGTGGTENPHELLRKVQREAPPIFFTPRNGGHWVATRRGIIEDIMNDPEVFSNRNMAFPHTEEENPYHNIPGSIDPPDHAGYRLLLAPFFSPAAISRMREPTREFVTKLIDEAIASGTTEYDFITLFGTPVPVLMFMGMMNMPRERHVEFSDWVDEFYKAPTKDALLEVANRIHAYLRELLAEREASPGDDLVSKLFTAKFRDRLLTGEERHSICFNLFLAGLDSVTASLAFSVLAMAKDRALQESVRANPEGIAQAVDEFLRLYSVPNVPRRIARDVEFHGVRLRKNDSIVMALGVASVDDWIVSDPYAFSPDLKRTHIAFGGGGHICPGQHMARMEIQVFLQEWLRRMPPFKLVEGRPPKFRGSTVFGVDQLWLTHA